MIVFPIYIEGRHVNRRRVLEVLLYDQRSATEQLCLNVNTIAFEAQYKIIDTVNHKKNCTFLTFKTTKASRFIVW